MEKKVFKSFRLEIEEVLNKCTFDEFVKIVNNMSDPYSGTDCTEWIDTQDDEKLREILMQKVYDYCGCWNHIFVTYFNDVWNAKKNEVPYILYCEGDIWYGYNKESILTFLHHTIGSLAKELYESGMNAEQLFECIDYGKYINA